MRPSQSAKPHEVLIPCLKKMVVGLSRAVTPKLIYYSIWSTQSANETREVRVHPADPLVNDRHEFFFSSFQDNASMELSAVASCGASRAEHATMSVAGKV